jgi:membrane-associated phospholipid phosphatase
LYVYLLGTFFNIIINYILKGLIKEPRPVDDVHIFNMQLNNAYLKGEQLGNHRYGMPSGHSQAVFFSVFFIYLALKNIKITALYLFVAFLTLYQRVKYKNHSVLQVIIGSLVGILVAYVFYKYGGHLVKKELKEKTDDYAPV